MIKVCVLCSCKHFGFFKAVLWQLFGYFLLRALSLPEATDKRMHKIKSNLGLSLYENFSLYYMTENITCSCIALYLLQESLPWFTLWPHLTFILLIVHTCWLSLETALCSVTGFIIQPAVSEDLYCMQCSGCVLNILLNLKDHLCMHTENLVVFLRCVQQK